MNAEGHLHLVLLPGLDGTGLLFAPLLDVLPTWISPIVISYPVDRALGYDELLELVRKQLPKQGRYALLGESFSGPIAIRLAAESPERLVGLILVATFITSPVPAMFGMELLRLLFSIPPPASVVRHLLLERASPPSLVALVRRAIRDVRGTVLAARVRSVMRVDVEDAMRRYAVPALYLLAGRDRIVGEKGMMRMLKCRPDLDVARIDAPHLLLQCAPTPAGEIIEEFLQRVTPDAPGAGRERG